MSKCNGPGFQPTQTLGSATCVNRDSDSSGAELIGLSDKANIMLRKVNKSAAIISTLLAAAFQFLFYALLYALALQQYFSISCQFPRTGIGLISNLISEFDHRRYQSKHSTYF